MRKLKIVCMVSAVAVLIGGIVFGSLFVERGEELIQLSNQLENIWDVGQSVNKEGVRGMMWSAIQLGLAGIFYKVLGALIIFMSIAFAIILIRK